MHFFSSLTILSCGCCGNFFSLTTFKLLNRNLGVLNLLYFHVHSVVWVVVHLGETSMYRVISTGMSSDSEREEVRKIEDMRS